MLQAAVSDQERKKMKRKGDRYSMQTSLIVAALKRLLPIGLNICAPGDQELIALAKNRFSMVGALVALLEGINILLMNFFDFFFPFCSYSMTQILCNLLISGNAELYFMISRAKQKIFWYPRGVAGLHSSAFLLPRWNV